MTMFMTKVWGFGAPVGPLQFSSEGWRRNALEKLKPGDLVVLVGTMGDVTASEMQGRALGLMEPTPEPVMALDFDLRTREVDFVEGKYKWPYGLMNRHAWSLPERPMFNPRISLRQFNMDSAQGIVELSAEEEERVRKLVWQQEELLPMSAQARRRMERKHGIARRAAPQPTTKRDGIMHMRRAEAYTYAFKIEGGNRTAFKIGWAFDFKQRADQFNHASMPDLGGLYYRPWRFHLWDTAMQAFLMEQHLLRRFGARRAAANYEILIGLSEAELDAAWIGALQERI